MQPPHQEAVEKRAYQIWEDEGRPHGRAHDHWHQAEQELGVGETHEAEDGHPASGTTNFASSEPDDSVESGAAGATPLSQLRGTRASR